ncbi:hypothetical protein DFR79_11445 [Halanaerobium saccharolyticum]|uniref:Uncharacterized protein n=1 Tax=Halanaerobium saccharolyticum TaxID=43595 RepID=A0A4V3CEE6_9FIRM|nr:hypothetical protein [Halanaerobium saccharolyticum]TDO86473.1 hypothetical protein DFR79_11445 [Halanaerobium saccharolyticum]
MEKMNLKIIQKEIEAKANEAKYASMDLPETTLELHVKNNKSGLQKELIYTRNERGIYKGFLYSLSLIANYIQNDIDHNPEILNSFTIDNKFSKNLSVFIDNISAATNHSTNLELKNIENKLFNDLIITAKKIESLIKYMISFRLDVDARLNSKMLLNTGITKVIEMRGFKLGLYYTIEMLIDYYLPNEKIYKELRDEAFKTESYSDLLKQIYKKNELLVTQFENSYDLTWFDKAI